MMSPLMAMTTSMTAIGKEMQIYIIMIALVGFGGVWGNSVELIS
jgi:hypothetical protein